jgi:oxygen-dependent protoporphyrinogen oxidase
MTKHVVVIGGGLAGTSAAHHLAKLGYRVTILEKNDYLGGRVRTQFMSGAPVEMGACFTADFYANVHAFLGEEGLQGKLYERKKLTGILRGGQVRMATLRTLAGQGALSHKAKWQMALLILSTLPKWRNLDVRALWKTHKYDDRSAADMLSGSAAKRELLEYLWQPLVNGYCYWNPEHVSRAMVLGLTKAFMQNPATYRLNGGLGQIPILAAKNAKVLLNHAVKNVQQNADGSFEITAEIAAGQSRGRTQKITADGIVCATTASVVPRIFTNLSRQQNDFFSAVKYNATAVLSHTYKLEYSPRDIGIAFPRNEKIALAAVTVDTKQKVAGVNIYASGEVGKKLIKLADTELVARLDKEATPVKSTILTDGAEPLETKLQRWPEALPLYDVGHFKRLHSFHNGEIEDPAVPLVFAGDYLSGPFMEGAFTSGMEAAQRLNERLIK